MPSGSSAGTRFQEAAQAQIWSVDGQGHDLRQHTHHGEAEGYVSGVRVLRSGDVYYYGFALDGLYLSGDSKRRIVSDALCADQNLAELADGENCMKFKNLDAENSTNSASIKNFAKSANSTSSTNSTNAANFINSACSAEAAHD